MEQDWAATLPEDAAGWRVHATAPFNAEPSPDRLVADRITPAGGFYIRSHGPVPQLDGHNHRLSVARAGAPGLSWTIAELADSFPEHRIEATLQCAGNRRADLQGVRPTSGDPWGVGAIGNAVWSGVRLADVLGAAGVTEPDPALHVAFACADACQADGRRFHYGVSIPLAKALAPEVLLATRMNGASLAPMHGYPLRAVVPGYAGVRSPKWLAAITVQDHPSDSPIQRHDYRLLPPDLLPGTPGQLPDDGMTIDDMPVNAAICVPADGAVLACGRVMIAGWAMASGRSIARVDVSADDGRHWQQAERQAGPSLWSWTLWRLPLTLAPGAHELVVRAWDQAGQTQPATPQEVWNAKGYLATAWHRIRVTVG